MRLTPETRPAPASPLLRHAGGVLAMIFGTAALVAGFWTQFGTERQLTEAGDLRVVLPLSAAALIAGIVAFVRRERLSGLAVGGMAMALAAPVLGWVVLVAIVAAAAIAVMLVIAKLN